MLSKSVAKRIFHLYEIISGTYIDDKLLELRSNEEKNIDQIESEKVVKLIALLEYAREFSPYYNDKIPYDIDNKIDKLGDLYQIPYLDKKLLRDNVASITSRRPLSKITLAKTSGSTGIPLRFPKDAFVRACHYAAMYRGHAWHGLSIGDREARLWGVPVTFKDRMSIAIKDYMLNRFREKDFNLSEHSLDEFYKSILKNKPDYIMGYGKMLFGFAAYLKKRNLDLSHLSMKMAKYTSENLSEADKTVISEVFSCPVVSEYGSAETGIITFQCSSGSHHIMNDCVHVEYLDPVGLEEKNIKEVVVTDLHSFSFPIIRYRLGDLVELPEGRCNCGLPFPTLKRIIGRTSEMFSMGDSRKFHSLIFYYIMKGLADSKRLIQFRVVQLERKKFCYELCGIDKTSSTEEYLINKTKNKLGGDVVVTFKYMSQLSREPSGKLRDFIPFNPDSAKK